MKLGTHDLWIKLDGDNNIWFNNGEGKIRITDLRQQALLKQIYRIYRKRTLDDASKERFLAAKLPLLGSFGLLNSSKQVTTDTTIHTKLNPELVEATIQKMIDFFSEFSFEPNFRFINTFAYACQISKPMRKTMLLDTSNLPIRNTRTRSSKR